MGCGNATLGNMYRCIILAVLALEIVSIVGHNERYTIKGRKENYKTYEGSISGSIQEWNATEDSDKDKEHGKFISNSAMEIADSKTKNLNLNLSCDKIRSLVFYKSNQTARWWYPIREAILYYELKTFWTVGRPIKIIVHGSYVGPKGLSFLSKIEKLLDIAEVYRSLNYNVILFDWMYYVDLVTEDEGNYNVVYGSDYAATCLNKIAHDLVKSKDFEKLNVQIDDIHVIGFSVGAHIAGNAGYNFVSRITGVDPLGGPYMECFFSDSSNKNSMYSSSHFDYALSKNDAKFVDIIHCNSGCQAPSGLPMHITNTPLYTYGSPAVAGHVDTFVNGGVRQPGCTITTDRDGCSHEACLDYFKLSITNDMLACKTISTKEFTGYPALCGSDDIKFGDQTPRNARGMYSIDVD